MDLFRWKRTLLRALGPAVLCAVLAGYGVYELTADERPTYRSSALLSTGIMAGHDDGGAYVRDIVINELEAIMNLARSAETREELSARLLAELLSLDGPHAEQISARAYGDFMQQLDAGIVQRHAVMNDAEATYQSLVAERDSLLRLGEVGATHPLIKLLYGDDPLVGAEQLATLRVTRKGMSDILELSYATVDAAWCQRTLERHLDVFLRSHTATSNQLRSGALDYFKEATANSKKSLGDVEERLRRFATDNRIINYYEQTRYIASVKNQVDQRYTEELMLRAAADSAVSSLEAKLAKRTDLVRLNNLVDNRRRQLGDLSKEEVRLEILSPDSLGLSTARSGAVSGSRLEGVRAEMAQLKRELSEDVAGLQIVHNGPEGLELSNLLAQWLASSIAAEEAAGRLAVLVSRKIDFDKIYTRMAGLGSRLKQLEREGDFAEENYLENLRSLNDALQREHSSSSSTNLRLLDAPVLPTKPEKSKRLILVAVAAIISAGLPLVLAVALMLLSGALMSFAEAHRRTGLPVIGGVARWSRTAQLLRKRSKADVSATSADLLWQNLRSNSLVVQGNLTSQLIVITSLRAGAGKSYVATLLAQRLAQRGLRVLVVGNGGEPTPGVDYLLAKDAARLSAEASLASVVGLTDASYAIYDVVLWELPALGTGRLPVDLARRAQEALLVHPAASGWSDADAAALKQLTAALGRTPCLVLNGLSLSVLLHEWGVGVRELVGWSVGLGSHKNPVLGKQRALQATATLGTVPTNTAQAEVPPAPAPALEPEHEPEPSFFPLEIPAAEEIAPPSAGFSESGLDCLYQLPEEPTTPAPMPQEVMDTWEHELLNS